MCTCLEFTNTCHYFGRTLDLEYHYDEKAVITPRNYSFNSPTKLSFKTKYALIGTAMVVDDYPFYYEASNEYGLAMAGLNFPYNNHYNDVITGKLNLAVFELIPYLLGNYKSIKELRPILKDLNITNVCYSAKMPVTPLHYMISDGLDCLVLESTNKGLNIYENKTGVMTNNPTFDLCLKELARDKDLTNQYLEAENPVYSCVGLGAVGLAGDYSSLSRFKKTYFMRKYRDQSLDDLNSVLDFFHILDSVAMVRGVVKTKSNLSDITFYTSCINTTKGVYYYKTYYDNQIKSLSLNEDNMNSKYLTCFSLSTDKNILKLN